MSGKYKRKGKGKFLLIDGYVFRSAAFRSLDVYERAAYLEMKWRYDGFNNGRIGLGCRELSDAIGCSKDTANRALKGLEHKGFTATAKRSGFSVKNRVSTEWRLTEYPCDLSGQAASKDFMRWTPHEKNTVRQEGQTVRQEGHEKPKRAENSRHSPAGGTVSQISGPQRSYQIDTYNITTEGRADAA